MEPLTQTETIWSDGSYIIDRYRSAGVVVSEIEALEVNPDETLDYMLNYWHGWWRLFWHWGEKNNWLYFNAGIHCAPYIWCGRAWWTICIYRLTFMFSCDTHAEARARYYEMFPVDKVLSSAVVVEDALDADIVF